MRLAWDDLGPRSDEALLCLPGWAVNRGFFRALAGRLSAHRRVLLMDYRGHGDSERPAADFGHRELADDAQAVMAAAGVQRVVPVAQAHGAWVALELQRRLGDQVRASVALSWLVLDPPPPFLGVLEALQDPARQPAARDGLFAMWTQGAPPEVAERVRAEMGAYDFEMWARAGREIAAAYREQSSPLRALAALRTTTPLLHLYSQPRMPEFLAAQEAFAREHAWFQVKRLDAISHFLPLEVPGATADAIDAFLG